jgi:hypothetical protein
MKKYLCIFMVFCSVYNFSLRAEEISKISSEKLSEALLDVMLKVTNDKAAVKQAKANIKKKGKEIPIIKEYFYRDKNYEILYLKSKIDLEYKYAEHYEWPIYNFLNYYHEKKDKLTLVELVIFSRLITDTRQQILRCDYFAERGLSLPVVTESVSEK